ncbi:hypothetical protein [Poriferisphaera sp. WC338]|uniref:hypothetical protein n=1 Tax=Poriferisphaera sp. WC338 TaxID=3425129 RepID=UPI003D81328A
MSMHHDSSSFSGGEAFGHTARMQPTGGRARIAARWVWISAGVSLGYTILIVFSVAVMLGTPMDVIAEQVQDEQQLEVFRMMKEVGMPLVVTLVLMTALPLVVEIVAGFGVLRGKLWAMIVVIVLLVLQIVFVGLGMLGQLIGAGVGALFPIVFTLPLLLLPVVCAKKLVLAIQGGGGKAGATRHDGDQGNDGGHVEPWNRHLG